MDSLYMTTITLATVGYGEVHEVTPGGRIFTVILIFMGVGFFLYVGGNFVQLIVEGKIREIIGRRKLDKQIDRLNNHFVVCGYGRIGRVLCRFLVQKYVDVVVIEQNIDRIPVLDEDGMLYVHGEATEESNLKKAGIERAKGLMTALGTDAENVFLLLTAKRFKPDLYVVARASQNSTKNTLYAAGADVVVSPYDIGARRMAHAVLRPTVIQFLELAFADDTTDIAIEEIPVNERSSLIGVTLQDSNIRKDLNLIIMAMKDDKGNMIFNPGADTMLKSGGTVIAVGENKHLAKLEKFLNP
jgi:voltage-gated potassium channel